MGDVGPRIISRRPTVHAPRPGNNDGPTPFSDVVVDAESPAIIPVPPEDLFAGIPAAGNVSKLVKHSSRRDWAQEQHAEPARRAAVG